MSPANKPSGPVYRDGMADHEFPVELLRNVADFTRNQPEDYWTGFGIEGTPIPTLAEMVELYENWIAANAYIALGRLDELHPDLWPERLRSKLSPTVTRWDPEFRKDWKHVLADVKRTVEISRNAERAIGVVEAVRAVSAQGGAA